MLQARSGVDQDECVVGDRLVVGDIVQDGGVATSGRNGWEGDGIPAVIEEGLLDRGMHLAFVESGPDVLDHCAMGGGTELTRAAQTFDFKRILDEALRRQCGSEIVEGCGESVFHRNGRGASAPFLHQEVIELGIDRGDPIHLGVSPHGSLQEAGEVGTRECGVEPEQACGLFQSRACAVPLSLTFREGRHKELDRLLIGKRVEHQDRAGDAHRGEVIEVGGCPKRGEVAGASGRDEDERLAGGP